MRAAHTDSRITVYQAYPREIAEPALRAQLAVDPDPKVRATLAQ
ncbi:DUF4291 family protein [Streptomyces sp. NPDC127197]